MTWQQLNALARRQSAYSVCYVATWSGNTSPFSVWRVSHSLHDNPTNEHYKRTTSFQVLAFLSLSLQVDLLKEETLKATECISKCDWAAGKKRLEKKKNSTKCKSVTGSFNVKSFERRKKYVKPLFINDLIICSCSKVISLWSSSQVVFIYLENLWLLMT